MRIAVFAWESLPSGMVGGLGVVTTELSAALQRRGHEVHVFCKEGKEAKGYRNVDNVHYHFVSAGDGGELVESMNTMANNMVWSFGETQNHSGRFDIAMGHDWMTCKAIVQVKNDHGVPCTFTFHSTENGRILGVNPNQKIKDLEAEAAFVADKVIAVSGRFKGEVMGEYGVDEGKCWVVPNGIQCKHYDGDVNCAEIKGKYGIGPLDPTILFCGRMQGGLKGADLVVEALPSILGAYGGVKAVFVGDGDAKMHGDHRSKELGVGDSCRFLGSKSGQELINLYKACDMVIVPSRNEPFGLVVLEAWAAGKPVIVSDQVGCPVDMWENGLIVSCTADGVAWGVKEICSNWDRAREMGRKGREKAAFTMSWDSSAAIQEDCLNDVLKWKSGQNGGGCATQ